MPKQRWAALAADGELLAVGITTSGRFERQCFPFSCGGYMKWVAEGSRYAELHVDSFVGMVKHAHIIPGQYIQDFPHGRIQRCQSAFQLL